MEQEWIEKLAIQELCSRYCHTIDSQDSEGWANCFTPGGIFEFDGWAITGHDALREYAEVHARILRCRHLTLNHLYEVHGDTATGTSTTVVTLATEGGYKILGQAAYHDDLVKEKGRWRIAARRLETDRLVSDPEKAVNLADPDVARLVSRLVTAAQRLGTRSGSAIPTSFPEKLSKILKELENDHQLEELSIDVQPSGSRFVVIVTSESFRRIREPKRQELVWGKVQERLTDSEQRRVEFIHTGPPPKKRTGRGHRASTRKKPGRRP